MKDIWIRVDFQQTNSMKSTWIDWKSQCKMEESENNAGITIPLFEEGDLLHASMVLRDRHPGKLLLIILLPPASPKGRLQLGKKNLPSWILKHSGNSGILFSCIISNASSPPPSPPCSRETVSLSDVSNVTLIREMGRSLDRFEYSPSFSCQTHTSRTGLDVPGTKRKTGLH